ncbi:hypothetical protein ACFLWG_03810 [Chloroflexota bacterium]
MKEEELIKKLENVELPDIKLQSHQRRLRMALLDADYLKGERGITILELVKSIIKGVKDTMIKGLVSRQPIWKTAVFGTLALALVIGMSFTIPSLSNDSAYAADIVQNSPQVQAALGGGEVEVVKVIMIDGKATVIAKGKKGAVKAEVDLKMKDVTKVDKMTEPTAEIKQEAIDIAKADPRVKEFLDAGAMISNVSPIWYYGMMNLETGEIEEVSETFVKVGIEGIEINYTTIVDLSEGKVVKLIDNTIYLKKAASNGEALQEKLAAMVEKGELTQEQADEKLEAFRSEEGSEPTQK